MCASVLVCVSLWLSLCASVCVCVLTGRPAYCSHLGSNRPRGDYKPAPLPTSQFELVLEEAPGGRLKKKIRSDPPLEETRRYIKGVQKSTFLECFCELSDPHLEETIRCIRGGQKSTFLECFHGGKGGQKRACQNGPVRAYALIKERKLDAFVIIRSCFVVLLHPNSVS